ncbi:MAG: hypothetical protein ACP5OG_04260 [Candidatus Nanoarchaeia archaeon]
MNNKLAAIAFSGITALAGGCYNYNYCNGDKQEIHRINCLDSSDYISWVNEKLYENKEIKEKDKNDIAEIYSNIKDKRLSEREKNILEKKEKINLEKIARNYYFLTGKDISDKFDWINFKDIRPEDQIFLERYIKNKLKNF